MENQWSDEAATGLDGLDLLAYRSRLLGGPEFVNPGGGNTSIKRRITDFQGRQTDVLTIKATGTDPGHYCHACFTGAYRVGMDEERTPQLRLFEA